MTLFVYHIFPIFHRLLDIICCSPYIPLRDILHRGIFIIVIAIIIIVGTVTIIIITVITVTIVIAVTRNNIYI